MTASEIFKIEISGPGLSFKHELTKETVQQILAIAFSSNAKETDHAKPGAGLKNSFKENSVNSHAELSIREFTSNYSPKRFVDFIATFGIYLKEHRKQDSFNRENLIKCFEDAGESIPSNLVRDMKWAISNGWIAPKNGFKDHFYVTNTGKNAVQQNFSPEIKKKTSIRKKTRKKIKSKDL